MNTKVLELISIFEKYTAVMKESNRLRNLMKNKLNEIQECFIPNEDVPEDINRNVGSEDEATENKKNKKRKTMPSLEHKNDCNTGIESNHVIAVPNSNAIVQSSNEAKIHIINDNDQQMVNNNVHPILSIIQPQVSDNVLRQVLSNVQPQVDSNVQHQVSSNAQRQVLFNVPYQIDSSVQSIQTNNVLPMIISNSQHQSNNNVLPMIISNPQHQGNNNVQSQISYNGQPQIRCNVQPIASNHAQPMIINNMQPQVSNSVQSSVASNVRHQINNNQTDFVTNGDMVALLHYLANKQSTENGQHYGTYFRNVGNIGSLGNDKMS